MLHLKGGEALSNQNSVFKALSDPSRRKILMLLKDRDMTAGEIADQFNISKPSISHHLNLLKQANLVIDERSGQNIYYSLNTTVFQELLSFFLNFIEKEEVDDNHD
ncbi:winged helix-turn-helix transcriptional regulator [Clostridiales bacterium BAD-6]|jgi:ArsR family transcriptional regulator|uniref:Winged helix-turn-helix transcriptional regulator n=1 Tax=Sinanaerobacter chloroacetimidivorans TaxID=2818044 RepID=A0A8J8B345_9FIRM|nr:winged helix-turn-helix transcriptional regulator [Sinanaerobacter chloroacetimidivorans]